MSRDYAYVLDMLLAAREALDFAATVDFDAFCGNRMAQLAILKAIVFRDNQDENDFSS